MRDSDKRKRLVESFNEMLKAFSAIARVPKDNPHVQRFLEAKDEAQGIIAEMARRK